MRKHAVIFMLMISLIASSLLAGCAGRGDSSDASSSSHSAQDSSASNSQHSTQDSSASNFQHSAEDNPVSNSQHSAQDVPATNSSHSALDIPASNESAVSDWGTIDADPKQTKSESNAPSSFSQVLVDREDLYFAIRDVKADSLLGYSWQLYVENRTDKNLMFSFEKVAVNGVMCDPYWAEVIAAGKKGNCEVIWLPDAFALRQISDVRKVEFTLNVYNDDDYTEAPLMHDAFTIYPSGLDSQNSDAPTSSSRGAADNAPSSPANNGAAYFTARIPAESDKVLVDNDDCTVIVTGFEPDNSWGFVMHLYLVNKTDKDLVFSAQNTSLNDAMCNTYWAEIVTAGNAAYSSVLWDKALLADNAISDVQEISFPLTVFGDQNIAELIVDETFQINP